MAKTAEKTKAKDKKKLLKGRIERKDLVLRMLSVGGKDGKIFQELIDTKITDYQITLDNPDPKNQELYLATAYKKQGIKEFVDLINLYLENGTKAEAELKEVENE